MSLYAIGDLHLHFQTDLKAKAQLKDRERKPSSKTGHGKTMNRRYRNTALK